MLRHGNSNLVLVIDHDHMFSLRRPFYFLPSRTYILLQSVKPEMFPCFGALVRRKIDAEMTMTMSLGFVRNNGIIGINPFLMTDYQSFQSFLTLNRC